mmetsp:Transcript_42007/g.94418  ORF Transcript_42007/g.94418 Transcript_42007/m.94418 type:complete len:429 (-) Transcript_42007:194-1480(-)
MAETALTTFSFGLCKVACGLTPPRGAEGEQLVVDRKGQLVLQTGSYDVAASENDCTSIELERGTSAGSDLLLKHGIAASLGTTEEGSMFRLDNTTTSDTGIKSWTGAINAIGLSQWTKEALKSGRFLDASPYLPRRGEPSESVIVQVAQDIIKDYRQAGEPDLRRIKRKGQAHEWFYTEKCREANASLSEAQLQRIGHKWAAGETAELGELEIVFKATFVGGPHCDMIRAVAAVVECDLAGAYWDKRLSRMTAQLLTEPITGVTAVWRILKGDPTKSQSSAEDNVVRVCLLNALHEKVNPRVVVMVSTLNPIDGSCDGVRVPDAADNYTRNTTRRSMWVFKPRLNGTGFSLTVRMAQTVAQPPPSWQSPQEVLQYLRLFEQHVLTSAELQVRVESSHRAQLYADLGRYLKKLRKSWSRRLCCYAWCSG